MADVLNLGQFRKRKERDEKELVAASNRASFGRTKTEKKLTKAKAELEAKRLTDHKRSD
jgi:Domain of unknown function (DUF4169)